MMIKSNAVINNPIKLSERKAEEEKIQGALKKLFVETMVSEMFKPTEVVPGTSKFEKEIYTEKMSEILVDQLIQSTDIRWEQILGAPHRTVKNEK